MLPSVRWKRWFYIVAVLVQAALVTDAQQMQQDTIDMSSDGWRPIVGSRRQLNQNQRFEIVQADVLNIETTTLPLPQSSLGVQRVQVKSSDGYHKPAKQGAKIKQYKTTNSYYTMPPGFHGSSIQIGANQQNKKLQTIKKNAMVYSKVRKPLRGQALAHSSRNEIFVPPPQLNAGSYSIVKSISPNNIKTREAQGFGLLGGANFGINQPNAHIEFTRFPLTGENILQRPTFFFAKPMQSDEFTRNLVPPPLARLQQQNKDNAHKISLYAFKEGPAVDATSNFPQIGAKPNHFASQVSPSFDFSTQQQQQKTQKEQAVDVQVTKENLKQFSQNGPFTSNEPGPLSQNRPATFGTFHGSRNNFPIEYVDYDFHVPQPRPTSLPNTITYEVTEGKWLDTPSQQYQLRPQDTFIPKKAPLQNNARPGLLFQSDVSSSRPPFFQAPLVELNVPAFLPTPYKPESSIIPTSPTQSEVSTIFNQVSSKKNRLRNNALKNNQQFFDITEVSTHYPILGTPEAQSEGATDIPLHISENGEISNEITTQKEVKKERTRRPLNAPTRSSSDRDPTKSRITTRRKPRPRKPLTTTTEETVIDKYEPIKSQEFVEEAPVETERPQRRRRPKPSLYRPKETSAEETGDIVRHKKPVEEEISSKQRGRYRFRSRERPSTERSDTGIIQRKGLRPIYSENIVKDQQKHSFEESTESLLEHEQNSYDNEPSDDPYLEEISHSQKSSSKEVNTQSQLPGTFFESTQEEPIRQDNRPFIEEIHPVTEKMETHQVTQIPSTSTTEAESSTLFHVPENEIDYTTQALISQDEAKNDIIATTPHSTTEVTTAKSNRIRRPSKYDSSNRPRFSVKDYRQRLNQYTSSTPSTTTPTQQRNSADNLRLRFPGRLRNRPSPTTASSRVDEDSTDEITTIKIKFQPKLPRHQTTTESNLIITEKSVLAVNTKLRPFGRSRVTTEATTSSPKISIRPNLFSARRRTGYPSLKNRIQNKHKKNETEDVEEAETTTLQNELEEIESLKVTETVTTESTSTTTDLKLNQITNEDLSSEFSEQTTTEDIMKQDAFLYSQRVSDLTSSFKDYDKPGVFNSVAPTSRSIPNYFTISTDDPILPIEAFFPNLKDKERTRKR